MKAVPDPRCGRETKHDHTEVLVCLVVGFLARKTTIRRSLRWCKKHLEELREYLPLKNGIASPSTACRLLSGMDEEMFALEFMEWIGEILKYFGDMSDDHKKMEKDINYKPRHPEMQEKYEEISQKNGTVTGRNTGGTAYAQNAAF